MKEIKSLLKSVKKLMEIIIIKRRRKREKLLVMKTKKMPF